MRVLRAGILGRCLLLHACQVACGAAGLFTRFHRMTEGERFCCGDVVDGSADMVTVGDKSMIPLACFEHKAGCPALGFEFPVDLGTGTPSEVAIQEQLDPRSQPTCEATEWEERSPWGFTMLLANQCGGCSAAGCIEVEGADPAVIVNNEATTIGEIDGEIITSPEQEMQDLPRTADELEHAAQAEVAAIAAARDEARVDPDSCSALATDADAAPSEVEGVMPTNIVERQHPLPVEETTLPPQDKPEGESAPEQASDRASAVCPHVQDMVDSFATEMDDIMKQHAAEVEGLRQHVLGLHNSSRALEERARVAEEYAQMLEHEVATSKIIAVFLFILVLVLPMISFARGYEEEELPSPPDEEARGAAPPLPLPPESAQGAAAAVAAAAAAGRAVAAARVPSPGNVQDSEGEGALVPQAKLRPGVQDQEQHAGRAAAVVHPPMVDAQGLERETGGEAAPPAGPSDEAHPPAEGREGGSALAVAAEPAPLAPANDAGAGPAANDTSGKRAGTEHPLPPNHGLMGWVISRWRKGDIARDFLHNITATKGADSAEVEFAKKVMQDPKGVLRRRGGLGQGNFGVLEIVELIKSPSQGFALKRISDVTSRRNLAFAAVEMVVFVRTAKVPHENVLAALAMNDKLPGMTIVMPLALGDLLWFRTTHPSKIMDRLSLVFDLARGAAHMHTMGLVHRDIKPENLLVFKRGTGFQGKLADFGLTCEIGEKCLPRSGSLGYMAPESMSTTSVVGATGHDVVGVAVVLLEACLKEDQLGSNLFTRKAMMNEDEKSRLQALRANGNREQVLKDVVQLQCDIASRTMTDGTFQEWLTVDKLQPEIRQPWELIRRLRLFLAAEPAERRNMDALCELAVWVHDKIVLSADSAGAHTPAGTAQRVASA